MVGDLRAKTGAGMMDCKKALTEAEGDMEQAIDLLRKKGLSAAAKKSGRVAAEGMIAATGNGTCGALVEVNSETDFVAKNDAFQAFANGVAEVTLSESPADVDTLKGLAFPGSERNVGDELTHQIATIGENMLDAEKGDDPQVAETARMLAMHVAAANPQYLCRADVPADVVEREKDIMRVKAIESGKPENIVEKIIEGQINKFFGEICLLEQVYVIDTDKKIGKVVEALAKELGGQVTLTAYSRFQLGEGIEKKEDDFAAEVASMTK
jgi:elongation factor Ts